jgi:putative multiple sugar transport system ATP-binding protein
MTDVILEMRGITKRFPGVRALDDVNLSVERGEIHALVGENGAGKSTLMKILSGVYPVGEYEGEIVLDGVTCSFRDIKHSEAAGVVIIHQELALVPHLSIAENIFLGNECARRSIVDWDETTRRTIELMERVGLHEEPHTLVADIGVGKQQLVEIAKALSKQVRLLILDEPTAALNETDSQNLLALLRELQAQGITSIMISHKLNEIVQIGDTVTVLRDGRAITTMDAADVDEDRIIKAMVGRDLDHRYPERSPEVGDVLFEVRDWSVDHETVPDRQVVHEANLEIRRGEIVGLAGLMGAGRTEFAMSVFGGAYGRNIRGEVVKDGEVLELRDVGDAVAAGLAYVTEDRKQFGLLLHEDIRKNVTLAKLARIADRSVLDVHREVVGVEALRKQLNIKTPSVFQVTGNLSGGNQQKTVLAKWIFSEPDVLILDEPTRGIDVGAKFDIYELIHELVAQGKGVLMISSELPELLGMCDRIYAMSAGHITGQVDREHATQEELMRLMTLETAKGGAEL